MDGQDANADRRRDAAEIRAIEAAYDGAWGADEARRLLAGFLSGAGSGSTHTSHARRISFASADVALFDGEATIAGPQLREPLVHHSTDVLIKREGQWRIAHVRAYVSMPVAAS